MIKTNCINCGKMIVIKNDGDGYFLGYDSNYYGDSYDDMKDPHEIIGWYCKICGENLRWKAEIIGYRKD